METQQQHIHIIAVIFFYVRFGSDLNPVNFQLGWQLHLSHFDYEILLIHLSNPTIRKCLQSVSNFIGFHEQTACYKDQEAFRSAGD